MSALSQLGRVVFGMTCGAGAGHLWHELKKFREETNRHADYAKFVHKHSHLWPLGDASKGEIQIVTDPDQMRKIEQMTGQKVGVVAQNRFSMCIYDAVQFPNGNLGIHGRFFGTPALEGTAPGAAVLPILPDGRVLLVRIYRHPLREWVLELPRGAKNAGESIQSLIRRELKEETGGEIASSKLLGSIDPDSGMTLGKIPIVEVRISKLGATNRDDLGEVSMSLHAFTMEDLEAAISRGWAEIKINGEVQKIRIGDSFLFSALLLQRLQEKK